MKMVEGDAVEEEVIEGDASEGEVMEGGVKEVDVSASVESCSVLTAGDNVELAQLAMRADATASEAKAVMFELDACSLSSAVVRRFFTAG